MHHRLEIIMPPVADIEAAVAQIMAPFDENCEDEDIASSFQFWDWYQIGGRYSGRKLEQSIDPAKVEAFIAALQEKGVTCSGLVWGKQELSPASQIPMVDALWREMCPGAGDVCPMFKHSGDSMNMDICRLDQMPAACTALAVIVAGPNHDGTKLEAKYMIHEDTWNGVIHVKSEWDCKVTTAIQNHLKRIEGYAEAYKEKVTPKPDWLVVTVDYHS